MKITLDIPADVAAQLRQEAAETALSVEGLVYSYMRAGMLLEQAERRESAELAEAERQLLERVAKRGE